MTDTAAIRSYASDETFVSTEDKKRIVEPRACPECGGRLVDDAEHGETTCTQCGLVVTERQIDLGPEWRSIDDGEQTDASRVGAPATGLLHDKGLSTKISWQDVDGYGQTLSSRQRKRMNRLRTWDERFRTRNHSERNLMQALGEIDRMASALGLSKEVRETAAAIYRRALAAKLLPGRSIEGMATAALYAAARIEGTPRSIPEVTVVSRIDEMEFKRTYRYLTRELNLGVALATPEDYVGRFASALDLPDETVQKARELLRIGEEQVIHVGKSPTGLAAAAVYAAARLTGVKLTQDEVSAVADVSTVTIRVRYQELLEAAGEPR
ncbi:MULTISPECIES: transcription initiation factor IIB family protein [unclassified Haladaptatus]|uniref:transcription initiation factor IIB n=1 Tax=unclassified Haladaptatus TaxID=2622732 RepID=UPI0023E7B4B3|nr:MULTISPECIES: TFIIB-type zinc ribbon-containing protein [unclassified Haladaptatus]